VVFPRLRDLQKNKGTPEQGTMNLERVRGGEIWGKGGNEDLFPRKCSRAGREMGH